MALNLLVVKMSSMGDVVHAQPLASDLRRHLPGARIDWVCESAFAAIPAMNPAVSGVIPIAWRKWRRNLGDPSVRAAIGEFLRRLRAARYDWVIDCQGLVKSALVARIARAARRAGPGWGSAREPIASLAYGLRVDVPWDRHVVLRNRMVGAAALGYRVDEPARFGLDAPAFAPGWLHDLAVPGGAALQRAVLITGASRPQKLWPDDRWIDVARHLRRDRGLRLVWFWGSEAELKRARRLAAACGTVADRAVAGTGERSESAPELPDDVRPERGDSTTGVDSLIPPFLTVAEAAGLLAGSDLVVGLDTGFTHLAGALGRPTIGIFCDFDAVQCAVSGDAFCASFGGIGQVPTTAEIRFAIEQAAASSADGGGAAAAARLRTTT
jgi:heptosyltransferase I